MFYSGRLRHPAALTGAAVLLVIFYIWVKILKKKKRRATPLKNS